ncbi:T9SS type A sorting domain-containing protein, partial [Candidatus Poribacteria bacterium]|nr:T9SS type A sorting domain-containing protein [Candidatus Poribacteria bacterium]
TEQPRFKITLTDDSALDETSFNLGFGSLYETLDPLDASDYTETFDPDAPADAAITYAPDLANGEYQFHITAADTSENTAEFVTTFVLNEEVTLSEVFNVPNPTVDGKTFFTYHLAQAPDTVTIKIYSVSGRLLRTLTDASANRGVNETYWDGRDETGVRCANGVYFYRVIAHTENGKIEQIGKLAILR